MPPLPESGSPSQQRLHAPPVRHHTVTLRAVLLGLAGTALLSYLTPIGDALNFGGWLASCHLPIGVVVTFLALLMLQPLLGNLRLRRSELLTAYTIMLVASGIPSFGLTAYLLPTLPGFRYFATPENRWRELFFPFVPNWLAPRDLTVIRGFFEGWPAGQPLPWAQWAVPLAAWTLLAFFVFGFLICWSVLLRRPWADHEHLLFPLAQLPLAMTAGDPPGRVLPPFFRDRIMWFGFLVPLAVHSLNGLHFHFPKVLEFRVAVGLNEFFAGRLFGQIGPFILFLHFSVVGFTFLLPQDLSFSLWFCYFLFKAQAVIATALGYNLDYVENYPVQRFAAMQMLGAFVALLLLLVRSEWRYWKAVLVTTFTAKKPLDDANEPLPYRAALLGLLVFGGLMCAWWVTAGIRLWLALTALLLFLLIATALARFVSEGGMLFVQAPFRPIDIVSQFAGTRIIDARSLTNMVFVQRVFIFDLRAFLLPSLLDAYKVAEGGPLNRRRLLPALVLGIVVAIVVSYWSFMNTVYHRGATSLSPWFMLVSPRQPPAIIAHLMLNPQSPSPSSIALIAVGAATALLFGAMRARYIWWPLHPIGYAMGPSWPMIQMWFSIFLGWLAKSWILRYQGGRGFHRSRPFFLGMVLGEFTAAGLWLIIDVLAGKPGHRIFLT